MMHGPNITGHGAGMRTRVGAITASCVLLVSACSSADTSDQLGRTSEPVTSSEGSGTAAAGKAVRDIFGDNLRGQLRVDLGLDDAEADCVVEEVLAGWDDVGQLASEPEVMAAELIERSQAAEDVCFSESRQAALEDRAATVATNSRDPESAELAFLTAVRTVEGVSGDDAGLVAAGESVCELAGRLGSLASLTATLAVDEVAAASLADELEPWVGGLLDADQLTAFGIMSVVGLCEELNDL